MDIHGKSVDMDMDGKFHIHDKPATFAVRCPGLHPALQIFFSHGVAIGALGKWPLRRPKIAII